MPGLMASMVVLSPIKVAQLLKKSNILNFKDYFTVHTKSNGLKKVDQAAVVVNVLRSRIDNNPGKLGILKKLVDSLQKAREREAQG